MEEDPWDHPSYVAVKDANDGRKIAILPMTFGKGRIVIGGAKSFCYDEAWCYDSLASAVAAFSSWNGDGEPEGWFRHPSTGRRRPDGDPAKEYVYA